MTAKRQLRERLIAAERRAAVAEHMAAAYRNDVHALIRELQRANGVAEEHLVRAARVFIFPEDESDA